MTKRDPDQGALLAMRLERADGPHHLVGIAQDLRRELGPDFGRWIARSIGQLPLAHPEVAHALGRLGAPILTTNYDDLLEQALSRPSASWKNASEMRELLTDGAPFIGHLHGTWRDPDSVIFSEGDYRTIIEDGAAQSIQNAAFTMNTFLFVGVGAGLQDPNFDPMVRRFSERFPSSPNTHFRLCLNDDVDPATELKSVVDVGFGDRHEDLAEFLLGLANEAQIPEIDLGAKSRSSLLDWLRDNSTLWREAVTLNEKTVSELIVTPLFLPEPHDQYATGSVVNSEKDKPTLLDLTETIERGGTIVIAGDENAGVSTAIAYCLSRALDLRPQSHTMRVGEPLQAGLRPIARQVDRTYREWGVESPDSTTSKRLVLGIDNLRREESQRYDRALTDIANSEAGLKIVGVRQTDVVEVVNDLNEKSGGEAIVAYLGRFSDPQARELARRVAPGREDQVARHVMVVIRTKNLPRTPFTITLLVDLIQSGVLLKEQESEIAVLDQYLNLLLSADFIRTRSHLNMTLRNKRVVLETIARKFVEEREDKAPRSKVVQWLEELFAQLGWVHDPSLCIDDLVDRRVLARSLDGTVRFQRSAYLELMAGLAAKEDPDFREMVLSAPIQLASIVRSYAAMTRNDPDVLEVVREEIARISVNSPLGGAFKSVRRIDPKKELFADKSEAESDAEGSESATDSSVERGGLTTNYYDDSDDSDTPAFMTARIEDLSEARVAMLVVDLASRVLRDSDEVRDQELKERLLQDLLVAWVGFTDLYETELSQFDDLDEVVRSLYADESPDDKEIEKLKSFLIKLTPVLITDSGIRYCLSGPSLVTRLADLDLRGVENGSYAGLIRTLALFRSGGRSWIDSLSLLDDDAVKSFFCTTFLATLARYSYITSTKLEDDDRAGIRAFLRRVIESRYNFRDVGHKVQVMNDFEAHLRKSRLNELQRGQRAITV